MRTLLDARFLEQARIIAPQRVTEDADMSALSQWRVGGRIRCLIRPSSEDELAKLVELVDEFALRRLVIGATTNLLFCDGEIDAVALQIGSDMRAARFEDDVLNVEAGAWVPGIARAFALRGLSGIEHTCGIPGSIGGLIYMNGGSQRKGIGSNVLDVTVIDSTGRMHVLRSSECEFAYRRSRFQRENFVISSVRIGPSAFRSYPAIRREMLDILKQRRHKFPRKLPNCGSVFVSDPEMYAEYGPPGSVIEKSGFKGMRIGDALVSPDHANFIVNTGTAKSNDILKLIRNVRCGVAEKTGYLMKTEVRLVRNDGSIVEIN